MAEVRVSGLSRRCLAAILPFLLLLVQSCSDRPEVTIGFLGPLEGKYSDVGIQGRNGAQLALEETTEAPFTFRLIAADDGNTPDGARAGVDELAASGAKAVIGPMISGVGAAALEKAEEHKIPLISPTVATPQLTGRKDLFFRVLSENLLWARALARHAREREGMASAVLVTDLDNEAFTVPFRDAFSAEFTHRGGTVAGMLDVRTSTMASWDAIASQIRDISPDVVVIALSARDAARLGKTFMSRGQKTRVYSAMWAATRELVVDGGQACAGWTFGMGYSDDNQRPSLKSFQERYAKRFGSAPSFAAALSYEAAQVLLKGLEAAGGVSGKLPEALVSLPDQPGIIGPFRLDEFGDVIRESFIVTFTGTEFQTNATIR